MKHNEAIIISQHHNFDLENVVHWYIQPDTGRNWILQTFFPRDELVGKDRSSSPALFEHLWLQLLHWLCETKRHCKLHHRQNVLFYHVCRLKDVSQVIWA